MSTDASTTINNTPINQAGGVRLQIQAINKNYGTREVLRQTQLDIEPGQFVVIVGRSG